MRLILTFVSTTIIFAIKAIYPISVIALPEEISKELYFNNSEVIVTSATKFFGKGKYAKLQNLLAAGRWKEADQETDKIMLAISRKVSKPKVSDFEGIENPSEDSNWIEKFPCKELHKINKLWLESSNGRFGFSVQAAILESLGGMQADHGAVFDDVYDQFNEQLGWNTSLNFTLNAPQGHLPSWGRNRNVTFNGGDRSAMGDLFYLFYGARACQIF
ncbi:GUN4 domain-containing protein [Nostoc sp. UHCC 0251]|uniref:GUN4 domain-containing protein n=1 Tax=Nostoc sp. UHCC 0251 TaxID=3110240 RepID=UPI002B20A05E|nr:GUN4 domain-containing protein [Nostoc sp. UHCC 0251]MEA5625781.1 GUN4 domain-containing protein [Nostoc sp. UHCC 0251]